MTDDGCPVPGDQPEITLAHGGGGTLTHRLIEQIILPVFDDPQLAARHDGAELAVGTGRLAFTTDTYVVRPRFFPGGNIGALAVNGTVNDLFMCGARPIGLSVGLVLEEGLPIAELSRIVAAMKSAADDSAVRLVTGDTKVVDRGHGDGIYVNTSGIGIIEGARHIGPASVAAGDVIILSGDIGRHGMAVMAAREGLDFEQPIESDTAAVGGSVMAMIHGGVDVHCLRDPTRGGLATTLVEIAETAGVGMTIDERSIPVSPVVRAACEILGLDPMYVASEGRFVVFVPEHDAERALATLRAQPLSAHAVPIGRVEAGNAGRVTARTSIGGLRAVDRLSGEQLPRIC